MSQRLTKGHENMHFRANTIVQHSRNRVPLLFSVPRWRGQGVDFPIKKGGLRRELSRTIQGVIKKLTKKVFIK